MRRHVLTVNLKDEPGIIERYARHHREVPPERVAEWERLIKALQKPVTGARAGEWWACMEQVFHLDHESPARFVTPAR